MEELEKNVLKLASEKGLLYSGKTYAQIIKAVEELDEVCRAILKNGKPQIEDGIGDVIVTLIILAAQNNLTVKDCLKSAWEEIKDRKGKTENGTFIKD